jgi:NitT/TauT family transport system substrate-binding protein
VRRERFLGSLAVAALATRPAPAAADTPPPAPADLHLASNAADDVTPLLWAIKTGAFAKAGLNVDIQKFSTGSVISAAVIGGAVAIGKSSLLPLISARARGIPLQLVVPGELWLTDEPISGMVVLKESPVKSARDLNGTTLPAAGLHDLLETSTRAWVDAGGGDSKTLKFVELPSSAALQALEEGRIAAATLSTPYLGTVLASGKVRLIGRPEDAIAKRFMITGWFATEAFVAQHRDVVARFAQVVQTAALYTNAHHAETVSLTAPFWGVDPEVLATMNRAFVAPTVDPRDIQPVIDAALKYGVIDKPLQADDLISSVALRSR